MKSESCRTRYRRKSSVTAELRVSAIVASGRVTSQELADWVREAVNQYHRFRNGHVSIEDGSAIKEVRVTCEDEDTQE